MAVVDCPCLDCYDDDEDVHLTSKEEVQEGADWALRHQYSQTILGVTYLTCGSAEAITGFECFEDGDLQAGHNYCSHFES